MTNQTRWNALTTDEKAERLIRMGDRLRTVPTMLEGVVRDLAREYRRMSTETELLIASCGHTLTLEIVR